MKVYNKRIKLISKSLGGVNALADLLGISQSAMSQIINGSGSLQRKTVEKFTDKGINVTWLTEGKEEPWIKSPEGDQIKRKIYDMGDDFLFQIKDLTLYPLTIDIIDNNDKEEVPTLGYAGKVLLPRIIEYLIEKHGSLKKASEHLKTKVDLPQDYLSNGKIDIRLLEKLFDDGLDVNYLLNEFVTSKVHNKAKEVMINEEFRKSNPNEAGHIEKVRSMVNELSDLINSKQLQSKTTK